MQNKRYLLILVAASFAVGIIPIGAEEETLHEYELIINVEDKRWADEDDPQVVKSIDVIVDGYKLDGDNCHAGSKYSTTCDIIIVLQNEKIISQNERMIEQMDELIKLQKQILEEKQMELFDDDWYTR